jgi:CubicO group peptidase (beta-lactamase class C family)
MRTSHWVCLLSDARRPRPLACLAGLALLMAAGAARGQASRSEYELENYVLPYNAPAGVTFSIPIAAEGKIREFGWGFSASGWRNMHLRYALPGGTFFEQVAGEPWVNTDHLIGKQAKGTWTLRLTEFTPGPSNTVSTGFAVVALRDANPNLPISGQAVPQLAGVEPIITDWLRSNEFEAATFALMRNGKLLYARSFGWQDRARTTPALPLAVGRLASNTKMLTATAIGKLIAMGKLSATSRAWDVLAIQPPAGMTVDDPRHFQYTVDQLIHHRAGLGGGGPPAPGPLGGLLGLGRAATLQEMISYGWTLPLEFDPDPDPAGEGHYSNWGYVVLGAIIEKVSGMSFDAFVRGYITAPLAATSFQVARNGTAGALPNELWYAGRTFVAPQWDWNDSLPLVEDPYADELQTAPGAGGMVSSAADYLRFLKAYFHTGEPKPASLVGITWGYLFFGGGPGNLSATREIITPNGTALEWALLVNESDTKPGQSMDVVVQRLDQYLAGVTSWPTTDLFHTPAYVESAGRVVMEAERFADASPRADAGPWQVDTARSGYVGLGYLSPKSGASGAIATWSTAAEANYRVKITSTGDYNVWVRRYITGDGDNSAYVGVTGIQVGATFDNSTSNTNRWAWYKFGSKATFSTAGTHTFNLRKRERDYKVDRIVLVKDNAWSPGTGTGPVESPQQ